MPGTTTEAPIRHNVVSPLELAEILDVSQQTILAWIKSGQLPKPIRIGRVIRWRREVIDQLLAGQGDAS